MKRMKKIMAVLLAAIMTMAMAVTAFADNVATTTTGTNTLTVNVKNGQNLNGQTIKLYKLFNVTESTSGKTKNYAYTVNTDYKTALVTVLTNLKTSISTIPDVTETSTDAELATAVSSIGAKDSKEVQKFANEFTKYALENSLAATKTSARITDSKTSHEFTGLDAGYYLVYVTGGKEIQSSLVTVDETTNTVNLKTEAPSITKKADKDTVSIGQVVKYTVTGFIPDITGYEQYVYKIHDELSKGLDFVNDETGAALEEDATTVNVTVAFTDNSLTVAGTTPTEATLETANSRKMSLDLSEWVKANQTNKGKEFTVTYYAKVNKDAVVTNNNKALLEYGNNSGETTKTTPSEAKTPTYPLDILKKKTGTGDKLAGAKFRLYSSEADAKANDVSKAIKVSPVVAGVAGNYVVDPASTTTEFESVASIDGKNYNLHVNGLAAGDYWLVETEAPAGYNKLTDPIEIKITKSADADVNNWTISKDGKNEDDKIIDIENSTGSLLPSTGGMGTIIFAVIAAILVLGVAVSFIRDKRKNA